MGKNLFFSAPLSYAGSNNPKKYNGEDDYSYKPRYIEDTPAYYHDLAYDKLKIKGSNGLLSAMNTIDVDISFAKAECFIAFGLPNVPIDSKVRAFVAETVVGAAGYYKKLKESLNKSLKIPLKQSIVSPKFY